MEPRKGGWVLSTELRRRLAMEALYWADRARARGRNSSSAFYRPRGRGRASLGWANWGLAARGGAARGDRRPAVTGLRRRVSSSGGRQQGAVPRKPGARERFWAEARRVGRPGGFAGVRRCP